MIRALITDFGGVLVRTRSDSTRRALERQLGLSPYTIEDRVFGGEWSDRAQRGEVGHDEFWRRVRSDLNLDGRISVSDFIAQFFAEDFLDQELMALIRAVRPAIKTGLISNAWTNARQIFTEVYPIADVFDAIVISAEEGVMKPDPRIYRAALERLGVQAREAVFIDDVLVNVQGAEAVGMRGVHFQSSEQAQREVRRLLST
jgi:epoxide hydrolase-like predicted phosphatase